MSQTQPMKPERLPKIAHHGVHVITTELLARVYGTEPVRIRQNHKRNRSRFTEGKHFYKVTGQQLKDLRVSLSDSQIPANVRSLILWTERGAARHAKMLETDQAWEVFERLEDNYFNNRDRRSTMMERAPLHHDVIDISAQRRISTSTVYGALNRWAGVKKLNAMSVPQVAETLGFSGRLKANSETKQDMQRIEANHAAMYGESKQLPLLGVQ